MLKHLRGDRAAAISLKMDIVTKVFKYGQNEYSRALNASYTFQPLISFWYTQILPEFLNILLYLEANPV